MAGKDWILHYKTDQDVTEEIELGDATFVIGRDPGADLTLDGDNVSREHCEIRFWDGDYVLKDRHSKNGTMLNGKQVDVAVISINDVIEVGKFRLIVEHKHAFRLGETQAREVLEEMEEGKGYNTILHEIVDDLDDDAKPSV
jgi:pSer/pThr/pTyr-binding forkhead associated (FHA) protein